MRTQVTNGDTKMRFGKFIGTPIKDLPDYYVAWLLKNVRPQGPFRKRLLAYLNAAQAAGGGRR